MILATPVDSPPVGERRHQVRLRARGEDGDAWWSVRLASGVLVAGASAQFTASPGTVTGSWGFGAPPDGSTVLSAYVSGQSFSVKINELYLDVDSREKPTFTPQILDGSGSSTVVIADTSQPTVRASAIDLDDLAARQYRYWVTRNGAIVWDTGITSGPAVNRQTSPLDNGTYRANLQIWSTLGENTSYPSDEEFLNFTVLVGTVDAPDAPTADQVDGTPFYVIEGCAPDVDDLDDGVGYIEIQRVDCPIGGYLILPGSPGAYASTADPGPALTDLEVIVTAGRDDDWRPPGNDTLAAHYDSGGNQRSWRINVDSIGDGDPSLVGRPLLSWSTDGTSSLTFAGATERLPIDPYGVGRLKVNLDTDDGAGGWTVTFYSRDTDDAEWAQLGEVVSNSGGGTTSLFAPTAIPYTAGAWFASGVANEIFTGRIYDLQVRDGAAGAVIVNPVFSGLMDGTRTFDDAAGNTWQINGSASIYSPTSTTSVAILGPLETGECASWTDYTLPRSGMGSTCDHAPVQCCSYYRARTVGREDGDLRISDWSDAYDPAIPAGMIVMWPGTDASVPAGWERTTELDGLYPKGIANSVTEPGITGGAATHTHTTSGHVHDETHTHAHSTNTGAAQGTVNSTPNSAGTTYALSSHTHTRPTTGSTAVNSGSTSPAMTSVANDPARLEVIFAESDGTPLGVPDGALVLTDDIALSGWTDYANAANRFLKGAAAAGDGGATAASVVDAHTHTVDAHTHTGTAHVHTGGNTGSFSHANALNAGAQAALAATSHTHPITINSASSQSLASASGGATGAGLADLRPPFRNVRVQENTSGMPDLPAGIICAWRGGLGAIPDNWALCDGTGGTLDLTAVFPQGATTAIGTSGGTSAAHDHTGGSHTHTTTGHSHTETIGAASPTTTAVVSATVTVNVVTAAHTHNTTGDTNSTTPTVAAAGAGTSSSFGSQPPHEQVAFVQLVTPPTPPPDPDTFCLTWDDDEHLIRSYGPDGPIWAPVLGKFGWDVDRPFTAATGVNGSRFVTSAPPGGRNLTMTAAVENEADLATLRAVLARPLVLISPSDASEVWAAPVSESVRIVKIGRIRQISASFIGTGPQPPPQLADVGV